LINIIKLLEIAGANIAVLTLFRFFNKKTSNDKETQQSNNNTIKWYWDSKYQKYCCPKCKSYQDNKKRVEYQYCECLDYDKGHYYFNCIYCKYNSIMRTADDN